MRTAAKSDDDLTRRDKTDRYLLKFRKPKQAFSVAVQDLSAKLGHRIFLWDFPCAHEQQ